MAKALRAKPRAAFAAAKSEKEVTNKTLNEFFGKAGLTIDKILPPEIPVVHEVISEIALRLSLSNKNDQSIIAEFKAAGLDHCNPFDWRRLLKAIADVDFDAISDRPKTSNLEKYFRIVRDRDEILATHPPNDASEITRQYDEVVQDAQPGGRQPADAGISKAASELSLSREKARRLIPMSEPAQASVWAKTSRMLPDDSERDLTVRGLMRRSDIPYTPRALRQDVRRLRGAWRGATVTRKRHAHLIANAQETPVQNDGEKGIQNTFEKNNSNTF